MSDQRTRAVGSDDELPVERAFGRCPKCQWSDLGIGYRDNGGEYACMFATPQHPLLEHFDVLCRRCHFAWTEPLNAPAPVSR